MSSVLLPFDLDPFNKKGLCLTHQREYDKIRARLKREDTTGKSLKVLMPILGA